MVKGSDRWLIARCVLTDPVLPSPGYGLTAVLDIEFPENSSEVSHHYRLGYVEVICNQSESSALYKLPQESNFFRG